MNPFKVERFMFYKGRKLYGFYVEGYSKPGVLENMTDIITRGGVDITYLTLGPVRRGEKGGVVLFLDFTNATIEPEKLADELKALEFIERVEVTKPRWEGFIADETSFPVMLGPHRAVILCEPALRGLLIEFRRRLGSGGEAMLYHIGREMGAEMTRHILRSEEELGDISLRGKFALGGVLLRTLGYGIPEEVEFREDPPYLKVRIYNCIECELSGSANRSFSHFIRGIIAGYASRLFNREMFAEETRCLAMGDPYCEFEVKPREKSRGW